jgi:hypothetical protein
LTVYAADTIESRLDWLTGTVNLEGRRAEARDVVVDLLDQASARGDEPKPHHWQGYSGLGTKHVFFGNRPDGSLCRLSGPAADQGLSPLAPLLTHVSRVDLCLTLRTEEDRESIIRQAAALAQGPSGVRGVKPDVETIDHSRKGVTTYIGARSSERYGRVYDKQRQSGDPRYAACLRYELEAKGGYGPALVGVVAADTDRRGTVDSILRREFGRWGVPVRGEPIRDDVRVEYHHDPSDTERRLQWLALEVRRTVEKLGKAGRLVDVYEALGLEAPVSVVGRADDELR